MVATTKANFVLMNKKKRLDSMSCDNLEVYNVRHLILAHLSGQVPPICGSEKFDFRLKHAGDGGG